MSEWALVVILYTWGAASTPMASLDACVLAGRALSARPGGQLSFCLNTKTGAVVFSEHWADE